MDGSYSKFLRFKNKKFLTENELELAIDYIYFYLRHDYDHPQMYAYYTCANYCKIVLQFKKKNNLELKTKLGEVICNDKLENYIEDPSHRLPNCTCGSTYGGITFH